MSNYKTICLIPAAGTGTRTGGKTPKQYMQLGNMAVLRHSVLAFLNHPQIDAVCIIYNPDDQEFYDQAVGDLDILPPIKGGSTRQESVKLGLESLKELAPDKVLIHDAARPLVTKALISRVIDAIDDGQSVIPALAVEDTLKKCEDGKVIHTVNRSDLMRAQTPQGFIYNEILDSHSKVTGESFTDDAAIYEHLGNEVITVDGSQLNFKITTKDDLERAERMMNNYETRIGTGFDVHKFFTEEKTSIILCGVEIPHDKGLDGHSDADVGLHALTDALLGAIAKGDIGDHFPPSDDKYKDMNSSHFVKHAAELVRDKGGEISNIDLTIICEEPKLSPYKKQMRESIAKILQIPADRVSIKATTTEGLGAVGRKEGIAAQAAVSVRIPSSPSPLRGEGRGGGDAVGN